MRTLWTCIAAVALIGGWVTEASAEPTRKELLERDGIVWGSPDVWNTPFVENLSEDAKIAGLSRLWMEVKLNFPRFAVVSELDWDKTYFGYLPRVRATKTTYEYYKVLQEMMALLQDGHSGVFLPDELARRMEASPPLRLDLIDGRVFITRVDSPALEATGVTAGLEILKVDGTPVVGYANQHRRRYVGSNTAAHRELTVFAYGLLAGPLDVPVELTLRAKDGRVSTRKIARGGYSDIKDAAPFRFRRLPGGIAYVAINTFNTEAVQSEFERLLPELRSMVGLVLDVRDNDGGSGAIALNILGMLMDKDFPTIPWRTREYAATLRVWGQAGGWYEQTKDKAVWKGGPADHFAKPIVVLTSTRSFSATDIFAATFKALGRGLIVGQPTAGGTGDPLVFALPGGGTGRVSTSGVVDNPLIGRGVIPDVAVARTARDFLVGRDATLDAGVAALERLIRGK
jgi:C-terminal processing protease CtpA/Prc